MIISAGSINLDLIARVSRLPLPGETVSGTDFETSPGGKGANQALAARRAGQAVRMAGAVGDDTNAAPALALLDAAGVDLACTRHVTGNVPTGVAVIFVDNQTGENVIAVVPGANGTHDQAFGRSLGLANGTIVLMQMEIPVEANMSVLDAASDTGATGIVNIAPYAPGATDLARKAAYTIANETEFDLLAADMGLQGTTRQIKAAAFVAETSRTIIVTLGADGAFMADADGITRALSPHISPVDTVGAGDTFCGYFAAGLAEGMDAGHALALACKAGALACLKPGAQPAIPLRADVETFQV